MITAKQRSDVLRAEYMIDMQVYKGHPEFFVFIDETGADRQDSMRRFGYSLRGTAICRIFATGCEKRIASSELRTI